MDKTQIVKDCVFFSNLPAREIATVASSSKLREFKPDEVILKGDEPAGYSYILLHGSVSLINYEGDGQFEFEINEPGNIFGLSSFLEEFPKYSASVISNSEVKALEIPGLIVHTLLQKYPEFGFHFMKCLAHSIWTRYLKFRTAIFERQYEAQLRSRVRHPKVRIKE
jgi:CRP-like cAMP-binding protein